MDGAAAGVLTLVPVGYSDAAHLVAELDADLVVRYDDSEGVIAHPEQFLAANGGAFFVATLDGAEAGCAGIRRENDRAAELKRMWVRPEFRGRGIARALLARCEEAARELGYAELWLETGTKQPEAVQLYSSAGYDRVTPFGQWADGELSLHLGRRL